MGFAHEALGHDRAAGFPVFGIFARGKVKEEKAGMAKAEKLDHGFARAPAPN